MQSSCAILSTPNDRVQFQSKPSPKQNSSRKTCTKTRTSSSRKRGQTQLHQKGTPRLKQFKRLARHAMVNQTKFPSDTMGPPERDSTKTLQGLEAQLVTLKVRLACHRSSFMTPLFTIPRRFSPTLLTLFLTTLFTTHAYGKGDDNKMCIGTRRTTRETTLVGLWTRVGIPGHLLAVPFLNNLRVDQISPTVQLLCKVIRGNPTHVGVPLRTSQRFQHHMDRRRRTWSRLEAATWRTRGCNRSRTRVRVKTMNSTISGFAPGGALPPRWSRKQSKDRPIRVDHGRYVPGLVDTSELEMPNVNPYTTRKKRYGRPYQADAPVLQS